MLLPKLSVVGLWAAMIINATGLTRAEELTLDGSNTGAAFEGLSALSAGASSRLLVDYPEPQRGEILDYLFKPNFGASVQMLKVEIGGDCNSTDGTEPGIAFTREEFNNPKPEYFKRGYEWWLMSEAKKRNPDIIFAALQWGAPGWVGNHIFFSQDNADLIVAFIKGAKQYHGFDISYCGVWNERTYDAAWIKLLRQTLNRAGLEAVKIVAADEVNRWTIADMMVRDAALRDAVEVIGSHYPRYQSSIVAHSFGKSVWASEDGPWSGTWAGVSSWCNGLGRAYIRNYAVGRMTSTTIWSPVSSYYDILPMPGSGFMRANQPWSGHYEVQPAIWITAHTTQFIQPGWKYLEGGVCAMMPSMLSQVVAVSPDGRDFSIVLESLDCKATNKLYFRLAGGLQAETLHMWKSNEREQFIREADVPVKEGKFQLSIEPAAIYSITTTTGQTKGAAAAIPASAPMPLPYVETFESYGPGKTPKFLSDVAGVFETAVAPDGRACLEQKTVGEPIGWMGEEFPFTMAGDMAWKNYTVTCDIFVDFTQPVHLLGRIKKAHKSGVGFCWAECYCLTVQPDGTWALEIPLKKVAGHKTGQSVKKLLEGKTSLATNTWHNFGLRFLNDQITILMDNQEAGTVKDTMSSRGLVGLGCGREQGRFGNLRVEGTIAAPSVRVQKVASSSDWSPAYTADKILESGARWNAAEGKSAGEWLELDFGEPKQISRLSVVQYNKRITDCAVQTWQDNQWRPVATANPIQDAFEIPFRPVMASKVRLFIKATDGNPPSIYEMQAME